MRGHPPLRLRTACLAATFALIAFTTSTVQAGYITGSEDVSGSRSTPQYTADGQTYGPYGWNFSYTRSFDGTQLLKHLEIDFLFEAALGYDDAQKAAYRAQVEANIEGIWNNKYFVLDVVTGTKIPVKVDVTTAGPFNQTVNVKAGNGRADMLNWFVTDTASVNAHEFGHMLGLFDEYIGGAVDQYPNPTLSNDGLMGLGALNANPVMYSRYYQQYVDYIRDLNPTGTFRLVMVPEPGSIVLAAFGIGGVVVGLRRRRDARTAA